MVEAASGAVVVEWTAAAVTRVAATAVATAETSASQVAKMVVVRAAVESAAEVAAVVQVAVQEAAVTVPPREVSGWTAAAAMATVLIATLQTSEQAHCHRLRPARSHSSRPR